jgi:hypothetical protein
MVNLNKIAEKNYHLGKNHLSESSKAARYFLVSWAIARQTGNQDIVDLCNYEMSRIIEENQIPIEEQVRMYKHAINTKDLILRLVSFPETAETIAFE